MRIVHNGYFFTVHFKGDKRTIRKVVKLVDSLLKRPDNG